MSEIVLDKTNMHNKRYSLKNKEIIFRQPVKKDVLDKWDGFWKPPIKFIDSYSIKIDGNTLNSKHMSKFVLKPWVSIHYYKLSDLDVSELSFVPSEDNGFVSVVKIKNNSPKTREISVSFDVKIDMRESFESHHNRKYDVRFYKLRNLQTVKTEGREWKLFYGIGKIKNCIVKLSENERYEKISNGTVFIPKKIQVTTVVSAGHEVEIPFIFTADDKDGIDAKTCFDDISTHWNRMYTKVERKYDKLKTEPNLNNSYGLKTPDENVNKAFYWALSDISDIGSHTDNYFTKDIDVKKLLWGVFGLVEAGHFLKAKDVLTSIVNLVEDGLVPSKIMSDSTILFENCDVNPLFLITLDKYVKHSGDKLFENSLQDTVIAIIRKLKLEDGLAKPITKLSILDSDNYNNTRIVLQALWIEALRIYHPSKCRVMSSALDVYFWDNRAKFLKDNLKHDATKSANALIPLFFDDIRDVKKESILKHIRQEFISYYGVRTRGIFDPDFRAGDDTAGAARSFATGLAAAIYLNDNDCETGIKLLKILSKQMFNYDIGIFQKHVNSADGVPLDAFRSYGTTSLFITSIDAGLFGIKMDVTKNEMTLAPKFVSEWLEYERFGKVIGKHKLQIKVNRKHELFADIVFNFDTRPGLKVNIKLPDNVYKMEINHVKYEGNKAVIHPSKNNRIWAYYKVEEKRE